MTIFFSRSLIIYFCCFEFHIYLNENSDMLFNYALCSPTVKPTKSTRRQQEVAPIVDDAADMSQDLPAPGAKAVDSVIETR